MTDHHLRDVPTGDHPEPVSPARLARDAARQRLAAEQPGRAGRILSDTLFKRLVERGIVGSQEFVSRLIIDIQVRKPVRLYVERFGDDRLLDVVPNIDGIEIVGRDPLPVTDPGLAERTRQWLTEYDQRGPEDDIPPGPLADLLREWLRDVPA